MSVMRVMILAPEIGSAVTKQVDTVYSSDSFGSRDYDPQTASWFAPDEWPGLIVAPQSLNRYAYVLGSPVTYADAGGFRPYEPGYSVTKNGQGWQFQKEAPAWQKTYTGGPGLKRFESNIPGYSKNPSSLSHRLESERHAAATRSKTATGWEHCGQSALFCVNSNTVGDARKWAATKEGKNAGFWLSTGAIAAPLLGARFGPIGLAVGVIAGYGMDITSVWIDCSNKSTSPACLIGLAGIALGPVTAGISRVPGLAVTAVEAIQWSGKIVGWNLDGLNWATSFGEWWQRNLW